MELKIIALISQAIIFLTLAACNKNLLELNYQINANSSDKGKWNKLGTFVLNKNQIFNTSNSYVEEKDKLLEKISSENFEYVLFRLCYDTDEKKCIQTYVSKKKIQNNNDFCLLIGLNNNYMPYILNYRTLEELDENAHIYSGIFVVKALSVSAPIDISNLKTDENIAKPKNSQNQQKEKEKPKSFIRKYWIYVAIFFLSLSISKHFTENMQEVRNR
ncbi:hypothetical protein, conserved [Plasmodium gonderi]|uniref:Lipoprotein n=1 Tax=Plasmodium gonderi TaxID=77519 RepID=A0A1Y1JAH5_PLAGO|nr:hypothetical protein, conserved [Plasmodium gonderi]GAW79519.1 hypothetical protein, conserved [Plasmodium gonderi]